MKNYEVQVEFEVVKFYVTAKTNAKRERKPSQNYAR